MAAKLCDAASREGGSVDDCRKLLKRGVDPSSADVDGRTALHLAASSGNINILRLLVEEFGANVNASDNL